MASHTLMHFANIHLFKQAWNVSYHNIIHVHKLCCECFLICLNWTPYYNIQLGTQIRFHLYATLHRCILTGVLCIPQCNWWAGCQRRCVDEVLGDKDDAADVLLLDIPDIYSYCKHSVYCIEWIKHKPISFLLSNYNLLLDSLDLHFFLTVSGETSISPSSSGLGIWALFKCSSFTLRTNLCREPIITNRHEVIASTSQLE